MGTFSSIIAGISLISNIMCLIIGIKYLKTLGPLKVLILIPSFSLLQTLFTDFSIALKFSNKWNTPLNNLTVKIYTLIEFVIIIMFLYSLFDKKNIKKTIIYLISIAGLSIIVPSIFFESIISLNIDYFLIIEGIIIELLIIKYFLTNPKKLLSNKVYSDSKFICLVGIFFSFAILWPTSVIKNLKFIDFDTFYPLEIIGNSVGYLILFISLSISFNGNSK